MLLNPKGIFQQSVKKQTKTVWEHDQDHHRICYDDPSGHCKRGREGWADRKRREKKIYTGMDRFKIGLSSFKGRESGKNGEKWVPNIILSAPNDHLDQGTRKIKSK
ncbi:hypothetical protein PoB_003223600 [Plakobranchus ocellatus]|uniref:Uncharacterized protein n=1 Tax=Plakobranchus ocellatus TaxID=259542 RepID=A0AAV4AGH1_9GAST|nr:hypothetical protein PoB_003223600 [Plakobranchus ocellatus]